MHDSYAPLGGHGPCLLNMLVGEVVFGGPRQRASYSMGDGGAHWPCSSQVLMIGPHAGVSREEDRPRRKTRRSSVYAIVAPARDSVADGGPRLVTSSRPGGA